MQNFGYRNCAQLHWQLQSSSFFLSNPQPERKGEDELFLGASSTATFRRHKGGHFPGRLDPRLHEFRHCALLSLSTIYESRKRILSRRGSFRHEFLLLQSLRIHGRLHPLKPSNRTSQPTHISSRSQGNERRNYTTITATTDKVTQISRPLDPGFSSMVGFRNGRGGAKNQSRLLT